MPNKLLELSSTQISLPDPSKSWENFILGCGATAFVYAVNVQKTDDCSERAAFKRYTTKNRNKEYISLLKKRLKKEASVLNRLSHKNIAQLIGVCYDEASIGILLELCEGSSFGNTIRDIEKSIQLPLSVALDWAHQIAEGMEYLVKLRLLHRDLKADNVLVKQKVCKCSESTVSTEELCSKCGFCPLNKITLKITDFGQTKNMMSAGYSFAGTVPWMAPEAFRQTPGRLAGKHNWTEFADVWSFGIVLWEILARKTPHKNNADLLCQMFNAKDGLLPEIPKHWPRGWKMIMEQCLAPKPEDRPRFQDLEEYFSEYKSIFESTRDRDVVPFKIPSDEAPPKINNNEPLLVKARKRKNDKVRPISRNRKMRYCLKWQFITIFIITAVLMLTPSVFVFYPRLFRKPTDCPEAFQYFEYTGFCYRPINEAHNFEGAEKMCKTFNSSLASIHSDVENSFVNGIIKRVLKAADNWKASQDMKYEYRYWIGLNNKEPSENWKWLDGSVFDYSNWVSDTREVDEDMSDYAAAVVLNTKKWEKQPDIFGHFYACKTNAIYLEQ